MESWGGDVSMPSDQRTGPATRATPAATRIGWAIRRRPVVPAFVPATASDVLDVPDVSDAVPAVGRVEKVDM
ncbi:hypothetical protein GCM10027053_13120 [Intrasporangium mesophilum]